MQVFIGEMDLIRSLKVKRTKNDLSNIEPLRWPPKL